MKIITKTLVFVNDSILVLRRSQTHPHFPLHLDFPGGEVEIGENAANAATREIMEETGITVDPSDMMLVFHKKRQNRAHYLFKATLTEKPSIKLSWEHCEALWMKKPEIITETNQLLGKLDIFYQDTLDALSHSLK
jgi:ADP-ribose pyrophosphatase YjhB (NUDIX family)